MCYEILKLQDVKAIVNLFSYEKKVPYFCTEILITLSFIRKFTSF